jgi:hypothetical protein
MAPQQMTKSPKRPRDLHQWAKRMVDIATGAADDREPMPERAASGSKGGKLRASHLTRIMRRFDRYAVNTTRSA